MVSESESERVPAGARESQPGFHTGSERTVGETKGSEASVGVVLAGALYRTYGSEPSVGQVTVTFRLSR